MLISIAKNFSRVPAGRFREDGPTSGQQFRDDILIPALRKDDVVEVDLDGVEGYGSSFLEEAFGGLVRSGFAAADLHKKLKIKTVDEAWRMEVWSYIDQTD